MLALMMSLPACVSAPASTTPVSPPQPGWTDPSPHRVRFVTVAEGVELEVLDWGGDGPALIFLAGLGCSAHIFDELAPELRDRFHVYGVTRRGFGASSQPEAGYEIATLGGDLVGVLRELGLGRASFVGHSIASEELNWLAVHEAGRVEKLVYLDAAYDRVAGREAAKDEPDAPARPARRVTEQDKASVAAYGAYVEQAFGVRMPEAELRATGIFDASGRFVGDRTSVAIERLVVQGALHPDYARITAPALAIYKVVESVEAWAPAAFWGGLSDADREKVRARFAYWQRVDAGERDRFRREVVHGQVVEIAGAHHFVFISHRTAVLASLRAFLAP
jgi:pimeloyl-ACP methyl ester carboxylesterase